MKFIDAGSYQYDIQHVDSSDLVNGEANARTILTGKFTINLRGDGSTTLNNILDTNESVTVAFLVTQGSTPYYNSAVTVDGSSITPEWQGGSAPTSGNASSIDVYTYTVIKTGDAAFTALASQTQFA